MYSLACWAVVVYNQSTAQMVTPCIYGLRTVDRGLTVELPTLKIGSRTARYPFVQGGMAVRVSTATLAAAVAASGGVGTIAGTGMTLEELVSEIRYARSKTDGIIGVNILFAVRNFPELVKTAMAEKVDFVVSGAGFSRDMFSWSREYGVPIVPIVSSARFQDCCSLGLRHSSRRHRGDGPPRHGPPYSRSFPRGTRSNGSSVESRQRSCQWGGSRELFRHGCRWSPDATRFIASSECTA